MPLNIMFLPRKKFWLPFPRLTTSFASLMYDSTIPALFYNPTGPALQIDTNGTDCCCGFASCCDCLAAATELTLTISDGENVEVCCNLGSPSFNDWKAEFFGTSLNGIYTLSRTSLTCPGNPSAIYELDLSGSPILISQATRYDSTDTSCSGSEVGTGCIRRVDGLTVGLTCSGDNIVIGVNGISASTVLDTTPCQPFSGAARFPVFADPPGSATWESVCSGGSLDSDTKDAYNICTGTGETHTTSVVLNL